MSEKIILSLGSNIGNRKQNIVQAVELMKKQGFNPDAVSSYYETEPVGYAAQEKFYNIAVSGSFSGEPAELLDVISDVETAMGRKRIFRNGPRIIDVDIILFGSRKIIQDGLKIPHPEFRKRRFVLEPLSEIEPGLCDPETGETIAAILSVCKDSSEVKSAGKQNEVQS